MLRQTMLMIALVTACLTLAGCGTVMNIAKPGPKGSLIYGGVVSDVDCFLPQTWGQWKGGGKVIWGWTFAAIDLPFTIVGDTLTLPLTIPWAIQAWLDEPPTNWSAKGAMPTQPDDSR